jgi:enamine deaminase RidA (YjgF/YER057c/UK114 family)
MQNPRSVTMTPINRIESGARMSNAVVHNGTVYLAGQVGEPGDDVATQTRTILAEIDRLLALAGSDKTRIRMAEIWLADMSTCDQMNAVWEPWAPQGHTPSRATGESRLAGPEYLVEIIVTAAQA